GALGAGRYRAGPSRVRARARTGAALLGLAHPLRRQVAGQSRPFERGRDLDHDPVVVLDPPLRQQPVERPVFRRINGLAADEQLALFGMRAPGTVRVLEAPVAHTPVTVDVLVSEAVLIVCTRVRPHARADEPPLLEAPLGAVRIQPRDDVEDTSVECTCDDVVLAVPDQKPVDEM